MDKVIIFHVEKADRSVGIMTEGFTAWEKGSENACELEDIATHKCQWYDGDGNDIKPPKDNLFVEYALIAMAKAYYDDQALGDKAAEQSEAIDCMECKAKHNA